MSWIHFLAKKYRPRRKQRGILLIRNLAILGVAIGVATLILTQSVMSGMEEVFKESILGFNSHLVVLKATDLEDPMELEKFLREEYPEQLQASTPFLYREGLLVTQGKVKGAVLKGIDPLTFPGVYAVRLQTFAKTQVPAKIEELLKSPDEIPSIVLGSDLAGELKVGEGGTRIRVFLPQQKAGSPQAKKNFQTFRVTGTFSSGLREFDQGFAFVDQARLQQVSSPSGEERAGPAKATGIEFLLKDPMEAEALAQKISGQLGLEYEVISWQRLNAPLFQALHWERWVFFITMSMVVMVAAFNIIGVLVLMIFDKSREISILRALGSPYRSLKRLFGFQGLWIALWGSAWGLVLGVGLGWVLKKTGIIKLQKDIHLIQELPVQFSPTVIFSVLGISVLIAFLATQLAVARLNKIPLDL